MALSKVNFNSLNLTPTANKTVVFNSNNNGIEAGDVGGALTLISTTTVSSGTSTVSITSGLDSTYKEYIFKFYNIHPSTDNAGFSFNGSADGGSNYNVTKTTTQFRSYNIEDGGSSYNVAYDTARDIANGTGFMELAYDMGDDNDQNASGILHLFEPSSTTFVKHFISRFNYNHYADYQIDIYVAGYFDTTSAINAIQFKFDSGNIDNGVIKLYGVS